MDLNNKYEARLFALIVIIATIILLKFGSHKSKRPPEMDWSFKGAVKKVWYDDKNLPYVTVHGKEYDLSNTIRDLNYKIHKGDTIIKQKGDLRIKIIQTNTRDTIYDRDTMYYVKNQLKRFF